MNWLRQNPFRGVFLSVTGVCALTATWFLFSAKSAWDDAAVDFNQAAAELNRLERLAPYPSGENLRKMKAQADDYAAALVQLKEELRARMLPLVPMAPNEFQSHLRLAMAATAEKARANKVRLPDKFYLGFDEFASGLPNETAAPVLGQELAQVEWFLDALFDARVDALTSFRRAPLTEEHEPAAPAIRKPGTTGQIEPKLLERHVVEATFVSTPAAARKVLNQIAGANQHFLIVRLLHVRNENDQGPPREVSVESVSGITAAPSSAPGFSGARPSPAASLNFIVGNERIETAMKIEIVRFTL